MNEINLLMLNRFDLFSSGCQFNLPTFVSNIFWSLSIEKFVSQSCLEIYSFCEIFKAFRSSYIKNTKLKIQISARKLN